MNEKDKKRHAWLVKFHNLRGWMNCSHKSLQRLEIEYAAITKGDR